jgi:hypothetical protein
MAFRHNMGKIKDKPTSLDLGASGVVIPPADTTFLDHLFTRSSITGSMISFPNTLGHEVQIYSYLPRLDLKTSPAHLSSHSALQLTSPPTRVTT